LVTVKNWCLALMLASVFAPCVGCTTAGATAGAGGRGTEGFTPPANVEIDIVGAYIGPAKADGTCWDGVECTIDQATRDKVAMALAETGSSEAVAAAVAVALSGLAQGAYGPPDPLGVATLWNNGNWSSPLNLATPDNNQEDTFTPQWPGDPTQDNKIGWQAPFGEDFRVHVKLSDEDLVNDDPIGDVDINYADVVAALQAGETYPVRVADQGTGLILFIEIDAHGL
jgi:hypothetical protein